MDTFSSQEKWTLFGFGTERVMQTSQRQARPRNKKGERSHPSPQAVRKRPAPRSATALGHVAVLRHRHLRTSADSPVPHTQLSRAPATLPTRSTNTHNNTSSTTGPQQLRRNERVHTERACTSTVWICGTGTGTWTCRSTGTWRCCGTGTSTSLYTSSADGFPQPQTPSPARKRQNQRVTRAPVECSIP